MKSYKISKSVAAQFHKDFTLKTLVNFPCRYEHITPVNDGVCALADVYNLRTNKYQYSAFFIDGDVVALQAPDEYPSDIETYIYIVSSLSPSQSYYIRKYIEWQFNDFDVVNVYYGRPRDDKILLIVYKNGKTEEVFTEE